MLKLPLAADPQRGARSAHAFPKMLCRVMSFCRLSLRYFWMCFSRRPSPAPQVLRRLTGGIESPRRTLSYVVQLVCATSVRQRCFSDACGPPWTRVWAGCPRACRKPQESSCVFPQVRFATHPFRKKTSQVVIVFIVASASQGMYINIYCPHALHEPMRHGGVPPC